MGPGDRADEEADCCAQQDGRELLAEPVCLQSRGQADGGDCGAGQQPERVGEVAEAAQAQEHAVERLVHRVGDGHVPVDPAADDDRVQPVPRRGAGQQDPADDDRGQEAAEGGGRGPVSAGGQEVHREQDRGQLDPGGDADQQAGAAPLRPGQIDQAQGHQGQAHLAVVEGLGDRLQPERARGDCGHRDRAIASGPQPELPPGGPDRDPQRGEAHQRDSVLG